MARRMGRPAGSPIVSPLVRMPGLIWAVARAAGCVLTLAAATAVALAAPPQDFTPQQVATGAQLYERFCSACHGTRMEETDTAFDLRDFPRIQKQRFVESVTKGKNSMPPWGGLLPPEQIEALWAYVLSRQAEVSLAANVAPAIAPAAPPSQAWPCGGDPKLLVDGSGNPLWISSGELMSRAISMPPPTLPASVGAAGQLTVDVIVDTQGRVKCARSTEGHPLLQSAATEAVRKWHFRPLSAGGQPVAVYGHLEITFYK